jgi:hypothetical protein
MKDKSNSLDLELGDVDKAWEGYAKSLGTKVKSLTEWDKQIALMDHIIKRVYQSYSKRSKEKNE